VDAVEPARFVDEAELGTRWDRRSAPQISADVPDVIRSLVDGATGR
jgi:hypothetical protein